MKKSILIMAAVAAVGAASAAPILWDIGKASDSDNTEATVADFYAAGVTENIDGATVSQVEGAQFMTNGNITVSISSAPGSHAAGGYTGAGASIIQEYIYFSRASTITNTIGGLSLELAPNTEYSLYLWGKGDAADQFSTFTYAGTSKTISDADPQTTDADQFYAKFVFVTDTVVADTLEFEWDRTNRFQSFNGFAIVAVPEPATIGLLGLAGVGLFAARRYRTY